MAPLPKVLIVGRPNVGKSSLVNRVLKKNKAITLDEPGVTRDISTHEIVWKGVPFVLMDSGGVMFSKASDLSFQQEIDAMVSKEIDRADMILFMVDSRDGVHPLDQVISKRLQPVKEKVVVAVNKIDNPDLDISDASPFYRLGLGEPFAISAHHGKGVPALMSYLVSGFPKKYDEDVTETPVEYKISFVGCPNAGKSSLINALINDDRMIVSDIAGTTRDAVDVYFTYHKKKFVFTDTAGLRKRGKVDDGVEYYSTRRTDRAIRESDVCVVVIDAERGMTRQDKKIIDMVIESRKNLIVFVNKWDLTERTDRLQKDMSNMLHAELPFLENYPMIFGSAKDRLHLGMLFDWIPTVVANGERRVKTSELNQFVEEVVKRSPPPAKYGKKVKVFYGSQVGVSPPLFVFFVNDVEFAGDDYFRFLEKRIRSYFGGFIGSPVNIKFKARERKDYSEKG